MADFADRMLERRIKDIKGAIEYLKKIEGINTIPSVAALQGLLEELEAQKLKPKSLTCKELDSIGWAIHHFADSITKFAYNNIYGESLKYTNKKEIDDSVKDKLKSMVEQYTFFSEED
jgi:hypothetical protein